MIIEESLADAGVLEMVQVLSTQVEAVTESHETPWLKQWTLHTVEIPEDRADAVAQALSDVLLSEPGTWYADFKNEQYHYIIYPNKVFRVRRESKEDYDRAEQYGQSIRIPAHQLINYEGEYKDRPTS